MQIIIDQSLSVAPTANECLHQFITTADIRKEDCQKRVEIGEELTIDTSIGGSSLTMLRLKTTRSKQVDLNPFTPRQPSGGRRAVLSAHGDRFL